MTALGCAKDMEVQIQHNGNVVEPGSALSLVSRNSGTSATIHVIGSSGSTGDESSGEEPPIHNNHYSVPPKKNRLKEPNNNSLSSGAASSLVSLIRGASHKDIISVDDQSHDDEDSGPSGKDGRVSTSLTSGENSDTDMGPDGDGDDHLGMGSKSDDSGKKMFECDVCNMKFSNGANMRRHRMRHTGVKPYECRICQKRFFRKDHLAEHMATHSKLLPFRCPICNKGFQRQIAMRAHFQNEHVGGSHDMVKACPLCSYKAGSMKSLRVHFYSRHGIDLDNPMPNSSILCSNGSSASSPNPCANSNGEYSELAQALGFEDREKSTDSSIIPSHFLVPQIEISSNSPYPPHFSFNADSSYSYNQDDRLGGNRSPTPPQNISPQSDSSSSSNLPSSTDLLVVKKEVMDETSPEQSLIGEPKSKESSEMSDDIQDMPEDLSSNNSSCRSHSPKCSSSSLLKVSPLKSLLRDEWRSKETSQGNGTTNSSRESSDSSPGHSSNSNFHSQSYDGEAITSSNGPENGAHSMYGRRGATYPTPLHQCVYCGIIFPDKTLYFLHKGCHSESNPWRCNICGESCSNVYDFNSHLLSKSHQDGTVRTVKQNSSGAIRTFKNPASLSVRLRYSYYLC